MTTEIGQNLLKSISELEADYDEVVRNMSFEDRAEYRKEIKHSPQVPEKYRGKEFFKFHAAHAIYWQIQAFKGDPRVIMDHPV